MIKKITFFLLIGIIVASVVITGCKKDNITETPPDETTGTFTDSRDGKIYNWAKIGNQVWMTENFAFKNTTGSWAYNDDENYVSIYGYLYDWNTAMSVVPNGWHLPSDNEWKELEMYLGMSQSEANDDGYRGTDEGKKIKSTTGWDSNGNGTDEIGFSALPSGYRNTNGSYDALGLNGGWWSSTVDNSTGWVVFRNVDSSNDRIWRGDDGSKEDGVSIRCIKD